MMETVEMTVCESVTSPETGGRIEVENEIGNWRTLSECASRGVDRTVWCAKCQVQNLRENSRIVVYFDLRGVRISEASELWKGEAPRNLRHR